MGPDLVGALHRYSRQSYLLTNLRKVYKMVLKGPRRKEPALVVSRLHALRRRLTEEQIAAIVTAYREGETPAELAVRHEVARSALVFLLHEHGLAIRNHGLTRVQQIEAIRLRAEGSTYVSIAERFGVHKSTVWHAVNG